MVGKVLAHYQILDKLGEGGMGVVYRALDTKLNRPAAIKFLSQDVADATARRRFQQEARMASSALVLRRKLYPLRRRPVGEIDPIEGSYSRWAALPII